MLKVIKLVILSIAVLFLASFLFDYFIQRDTHTIYVGVDPYSAPFSSSNNVGELRGFDVDLVNAIAKAIDVNIEFRIIPFSNLEKSLINNQIDLFIAPFDTVQTKLPSEYLYTLPYFRNNIVAITKTQKLSHELFARNKVLSTSVCITDKPHVLKYVRQNKNKVIKVYANSSELFSAMYKGDCQVIYDSYSSARYYITKHKLEELEIKNVDADKHFHLYRIILSLEHQKLRDKINQALIYIYQTDLLNRLNQKWFSSKSNIIISNDSENIYKTTQKAHH